MEEQKTEHQQRDARAKETVRKGRPMCTGVRGIVLTYDRNKKFRAGEWKTYYYPIIKVNGSHNKIRFFKGFRIKTCGYNEAWNRAVTFYAESKCIKFYGHLLKKRPDISQFEIVRQFLNKSRNYDISDKLIFKEDNYDIV